MKICIAQTKSLKGKLQENILNHLKMIEYAVSLDADFIVFPELSITNFEPALANKFATNVENAIFDPFQRLSDEYNITTGVGMPTHSDQGICISMLIFQPNGPRLTYSKQMLHSDELPYFVCGSTQTFLNIKGYKIAVGICYEALQPEHFANAKKNNADIYIASVAKPKNGIESAHKYFSKLARDSHTPILLCNSIGYCDNFISSGQSSVWNKKGTLIGQLDSENQGILIYDTETGFVLDKQLS